MDLFDRTLTTAQRHLKYLADHVGTTSVPPELLRETLGSLPVTLDELCAAAEDIRQKGKALKGNRNPPEAERQSYQGVLEKPDDGHLITDQRGVIQEADRYAVSWLRTPQHYLVGRPLMVYIKAADRPAFWALLARLQMPGTRQACELHMRPRAGVLSPALLEPGDRLALVPARRPRAPTGRRGPARQ